MLHIKRKEYINFLLSRIEKDMIGYSRSPGVREAEEIINILKNTDDIMREIYVVSSIKKLKNLSNYLVFIVKKIDEKKILFENLLENIYEDREFIKGEIFECFSINTQEDKTAHTEKPGTLKTEERTGETKIPTYKIPETQFIVKNLENELVTEEFNESEMLIEYDLAQGGKFLELVNGEEGGKYTGREKEIEGEKADKENVFSFPGREEKEKEKKDTKTKKEEITRKAETESEKTKEELLEDKTKAKIKEEQETLFEEIVGGKESIISTEVQKEGNIEKDNNSITITEESKKDTKEETFVEIEETNKKTAKYRNETDLADTYKATNNEAVSENDKYSRYERELLIINDKLLSDIEDYYQLAGKEGSGKIIEKITQKILENSSYMTERSSEMSFELITSIYETIKLVFQNILKFDREKAREKAAPLLIEGIGVIGSLIKGEERTGFGETLKKLDELKIEFFSDVTEKKEETEKNVYAEKAEQKERDKIDTPQKDKLILLKQNILDIENVFKTLSEIKGEYQAYEALRRLSSTFSKFKNIVRISRELEMNKMAQLAESSYTFIKFLQNYRVNPFEEEINEVFKYLAYSFKLLFLDKPAKDLELFISYLNEPVKIFINKK